MKKIILGIETSCDDTSIAVMRGEIGQELRETLPEVLSFKSFSQEFILQKWGGVVPEIAARNHNEKILPLLQECLQEAALGCDKIDLIGVTAYPGLLGPLLTGLNSAKTLSLMYEIPLLPVNHLFAHLEAIFITENITYPYLGLLVSGGHSAYFLVHSSQDFQLLGTTIDDAAGEAFDKGGKLMGLAYPAGRLIDEHAKLGNSQRFPFPIALKDSKNSQLSFSGVKTSLKVFLEKNSPVPEQDFNDLCASYQQAIIDALKLKLKYALQEARAFVGNKTLPIVVGGGVACNSSLRQQLTQNFPQVYFVPPKYCTDNGAMIANYALRNFNHGLSFPQCLEIDARGKYLQTKGLTS